MNVTSFFRNVTKPVLTIPKLSEMRTDAYRPDLVRKIDAQLETAARLLATANFYRWDRRMLPPAIERWSADELRFIGLDLTDFCRVIELEYNVQTEDGQSWRLDRVIGDRLWAAAIRPEVLPLANFDVEVQMRRQAEQRKEKTNAHK